MLRKLLFLLLLGGGFGQLFAQEPFEPAEPYEPSYVKNQDEDWVSYLGLGAGYGAYVPAAQSKLGIFHGVNTEFVWLSGHNSGGSRSPSNWRVYSRVGIMKSTQDSVGGLISYLMGANFSLESRVKRKWLIPYIGIEIGGIKQKELGGGMQFNPVLGVQLLATKYACIHAQASYTYSTRAFDQLSGFCGTVTANFFFWRD